VRGAGATSGEIVACGVAVGTTIGRAVKTGCDVGDARAMTGGCADGVADAGAVERFGFARADGEVLGRGVREGCGRGVTGGIGVALAIGVTGGGFIAVCATDPRLPKKCANKPPRSNPAKTTMIISGTTGRPPLSCCSSSPRRRRGV
jgi:hypothetical protein